MDEKRKKEIEAGHDRFVMTADDVGEPLSEEETEALLKKAHKKRPDLFPKHY